MPDIFPEGEALRKAVTWLSLESKLDFKAVQAASFRFDLSPKDEAFLIRQFHSKKAP